jgi:hypothetical protein
VNHLIDPESEGTTMYVELARATIRDLHRQAAIASTARAADRNPGRLRRLVTSRRVGG